MRLLHAQRRRRGWQTLRRATERLVHIAGDGTAAAICAATSAALGRTHAWAVSTTFAIVLALGIMARRSTSSHAEVDVGARTRSRRWWGHARTRRSSAGKSSVRSIEASLD